MHHPNSDLTQGDKEVKYPSCYPVCFVLLTTLCLHCEYVLGLQSITWFTKQKRKKINPTLGLAQVQQQNAPGSWSGKTKQATGGRAEFNNGEESVSCAVWK